MYITLLLGTVRCEICLLFDYLITMLLSGNWVLLYYRNGSRGRAVEMQIQSVTLWVFVLALMAFYY